MKRALKYLAFILLIYFFSYCGDKSPLISNNDLPSFNIPNDSVIVQYTPIESRIILKLWEDIFNNKELELICYTEYNYSSTGYSILVDYNLVKDTLKIDFLEIVEPPMGLAIFAPARTDIPLINIDSKPYLLKLNINNSTILGVLTITDELFKIKLQPNNIFINIIPNLFRVPEEIIWGIADSFDPEKYILFLDSLELIGAADHNLSPGKYNYFEIGSFDKFIYNANFHRAFGSKFIYEFKGDTLLTRNLIKRFSKRYSASIGIHMFGGRGEMYNSNILENEP